MLAYEPHRSHKAYRFLIGLIKLTEFVRFATTIISNKFGCGYLRHLSFPLSVWKSSMHSLDLSLIRTRARLITQTVG